MASIDNIAFLSQKAVGGSPDASFSVSDDLTQLFDNLMAERARLSEGTLEDRLLSQILKGGQDYAEAVNEVAALRAETASPLETLRAINGLAQANNRAEITAKFLGVATQAINRVVSAN